MRFVATTALVFLFFQAGQGPAQQQSQNLPAIIEGLVLQAGSGEPIAKAQVTVTRVVSNPTAIPATPPPLSIPQIPPVLTDAAGKFSFANLEPGSVSNDCRQKWFRAHELRRALFRRTGNDRQRALRADSERVLPSYPNCGCERPGPGFLRGIRLRASPFSCLSLPTT